MFFLKRFIYILHTYIFTFIYSMTVHVYMYIHYKQVMGMIVLMMFMWVWFIMSGCLNPVMNLVIISILFKYFTGLLI